MLTAARLRRLERSDPDFQRFAREAGCLIGAVLGFAAGCDGPVQFHHEPPRSHVADWHDRLGVGLCWRHHEGPGSRHDLGSLELFEARWGVPVWPAILQLNLDYPGLRF